MEKIREMDSAIVREMDSAAKQHSAVKKKDVEENIIFPDEGKHFE